MAWPMFTEHFHCATRSKQPHRYHETTSNKVNWNYMVFFYWFDHKLFNHTGNLIVRTLINWILQVNRKYSTNIKPNEQHFSISTTIPRILFIAIVVVLPFPMSSLTIIPHYFNPLTILCWWLWMWCVACLTWIHPASGTRENIFMFILIVAGPHSSLPWWRFHCYRCRIVCQVYDIAELTR